MLTQLVQTLCRHEEGQMLVEYLLLLSMLVALVLVTINLYVGPLGEIYAEINQTFGELFGGAAF